MFKGAPQSATIAGLKSLMKMKQTEYKTFKDLQFEPWGKRHGMELTTALGRHFHTQAVMEFPNGYSVSVLHGEQFYSDDNTYEVAVMKDNNVVYPANICPDGDVLGWQTREQVTEIMKKVQEL